MCSSSFYDIIRVLEDSLCSGLLSSSVKNDLKLYKPSKDQKDIDYICYIGNQQCALQASTKWESMCVEEFPWIKDYIKVILVPHGFGISLNRNMCFNYGLENILKSGKQYGYNSLFSGKVYNLSVKNMKSPGCITNLRLEIASEVLGSILKACGGSICSHTDCSRCSKLHITTKNICCDNCINILVGPVIAQTLDKSVHVDSDVYQRFRLDNISLMCEHKEDVSDSIESKKKLLKSIIYFDLLQSNIWRSVTLHLLDKSSDKTTSCKGSMFVMYNYARLHTLCEQFNEKVSSGLYPPLPTLDATDISLLGTHEEWLLMLDCILCWPSILRKSMIEFEFGRPKIHLIFEFLKTISNHFSHYYHKTRIFTEPRSHLLPALFARMHLLKSLLIVFEIALELVCISPLKRM